MALTERQLWLAHDRQPQTLDAEGIRYLAQAMEAYMRHTKVHSEDPRDLKERAELKATIRNILSAGQDTYAA